MIGTVSSWTHAARQAVSARPDRVRLGVEFVLAALLAVQAGRLGWIMLSPQPAPAAPAAARGTVQPVDYSIFERFDAFFRTGGQSSLAEATNAGSGQMRLFGVRSDGRGGGSAIIGLADGRQVSVGVGEEIEPGLVLHAVGSDFVTVSRGGSVSRLIFSELPVGAATPPPPPAEPQVVTPQAAPAPAVPSAPAGPAVDPARLVGQASLRPRMQGLSVNGFTVSAAGDGAALKAAGLQSGDVILAVNGQALNSVQAVAGLRSRLSNAPSAEIRFERNGQVQTTTIRTGQ